MAERVKILTITPSLAQQCCIYFILPKLIKIVKNVIRFEWKIPILAQCCVTLFRIYITSSQQPIAIHPFNVNLAHFQLQKYFYMGPS